MRGVQLWMVSMLCVNDVGGVWLTDVAGKGLQQLTTAALATGFQISDSNPILGLEARADLLRGLGTSLLSKPVVFGPEGRPGNVVGARFITIK
jgi:hypothetical protein